MTTSAHQLMRTVDCAVSGCPSEAEKGSEVCRDHRLRPITPERPADGGPLPVGRIEEDSAPRCKVDGCTNASAGKGGSWHGLCQSHIAIEGRRRQLARRDRTAAAVKPPPAAPVRTGKERSVPDPVSSIAAKAARLAHLSLEIEQTRDRLVELQGEALALLDELREQVAA